MDPNMQTQAGQDPTMHVTAPAAITAPLPVTLAPNYKYYHCAVPAASMHREDGKKIAFLNGICETNILYDQIYLDTEIDKGSQYVRLATQTEIDGYKMFKDPHGTMKEKVSAEIRADLETELRAKLEAEIKAKYGIAPDPEDNKPATPEAAETDGNKLAGTNIRAKINAANAVTKVEGAKVVMQNSPAPALTPVSTAQLETAPISGK